MSRSQNIRISRPLGGRLPGFDTALGVALLTGLAIAAAFICLRALGVLTAGELLPTTILEAWLVTMPPWGKLAVAAGSMLMGLLALWALLARLAPGRIATTPTPLVLEHDESGIVVVDGECVAAVAEHAAATTPGVWEADVRVTPRGHRTIDLRVVVSMLEGSDLRRGAVAARDRAAAAVERLVGVDVRRTQVRVELVEPSEIGRRTA